MSKDIDDLRRRMEAMAIDVDVLKKNHVSLNIALVETLKNLSEMTSLATNAALSVVRTFGSDCGVD